MLPHLEHKWEDFRGTLPLSRLGGLFGDRRALRGKCQQAMWIGTEGTQHTLSLRSCLRGGSTKEGKFSAAAGTVPPLQAIPSAPELWHTRGRGPECTPAQCWPEYHQG